MEGGYKSLVSHTHSPFYIRISTIIIFQEVRVAVSEDLAVVEKLYAEFNQVERLAQTN